MREPEQTTELKKPPQSEKDARANPHQVLPGTTDLASLAIAAKDLISD
jgi:hypothetical protein